MLSSVRYILLFSLSFIITPAWAADKIVSYEISEPNSFLPALTPTEHRLGTVAVDKIEVTPILWTHKDDNDFDTLKTLFDSLPVHTASPTTFSLKMLLLSSLGTFPGNHKELARLQLEQLTAMGDDEILMAKSTTEPFEKIRVERLLLQSHIKEACAKSAATPAFYTSTFWPELSILCHIDRKEYAKAKLEFDLMDEGKQEVPSYLEPLIAKIIGESDAALPEALTIPQNALHFALLGKAKINFSMHIAELTPIMQRAIALNPMQPFPIRLVAGEAAFRSGSISADDLTTLYMKMHFQSSELADFTPDDNPYEGTAQGRALLYQYSHNQHIDTTIAAAIRAFTEDGYKDIALAIFLPDVINVSSNIKNITSDELLDVLLAGNQLPPVTAWLTNGKATKSHKARIALLLAIATNRQALPFGELAYSDPVFTERLILLLDALGYAIPETAWNQLSKMPFTYRATVMGRAVSTLLKQAGEQHRKGALVIATLLALGGHKANEIDNNSIAMIVRLLSENGFKKEARSLALEALL